ncbi:unnamed protein product [Owenia fusiformis]|uniref:Uncharacterized protein n=1 Tax=Owenia fusiformis TaxID=6347 RepID=A0A8J1T5G6_OWEFU|nr:unnamed protein product [Owenia fusiformis]
MSSSAAVKQRRRESDAKWRANIANCYNSLKNIVLMNKTPVRKKVSKALILQETENHRNFLEDLLESLLCEKAKVLGLKKIPPEDSLTAVKARFIEENSKYIPKRPYTRRILKPDITLDSPLSAGKKQLTAKHRQGINERLNKVATRRKSQLAKNVNKSSGYSFKTKVVQEKRSRPPCPPLPQPTQTITYNVRPAVKGRPPKPTSLFNTRLKEASASKSPIVTCVLTGNDKPGLHFRVSSQPVSGPSPVKLSHVLTPTKAVNDVQLNHSTPSQAASNQVEDLLLCTESLDDLEDWDKSLEQTPRTSTARPSGRKRVRRHLYSSEFSNDAMSKKENCNPERQFNVYDNVAPISLSPSPRCRRRLDQLYDQITQDGEIEPDRVSPSSDQSCQDFDGYLQFYKDMVADIDGATGLTNVTVTLSEIWGSMSENERDMYRERAHQSLGDQHVSNNLKDPYLPLLEKEEGLLEDCSSFLLNEASCFASPSFDLTLPDDPQLWQLTDLNATDEMAILSEHTGRYALDDLSSEVPNCEPTEDIHLGEVQEVPTLEAIVTDQGTPDKGIVVGNDAFFGVLDGDDTLPYGLF